MKTIQFPKPAALPKVLSIDEFKGNSGGQKFQAILTDARDHRLFDILPSRNQTDLMQYLLSFPNRKDVQYLITDMNQVYRDLAVQFFPNAKIVIDKFHVVRYVTWALENVRNSNELSFIEIEAAIGSRADLGRPTTTPIENKNNFMSFLAEE